MLLSERIAHVGLISELLIDNNNTFTWSGPSGVMTAPDNGPEGRLTGWCSRTSMAMSSLCHINDQPNERNIIRIAGSAGLFLIRNGLGEMHFGQIVDFSKPVGRSRDKRIQNEKKKKKSKKDRYTDGLDLNSCSQRSSLCSVLPFQSFKKE
jgi:hypothetical protein